MLKDLRAPETTECPKCYKEMKLKKDKYICIECGSELKANPVFRKA